MKHLVFPAFSSAPRGENTEKVLACRASSCLVVVKLEWVVLKMFACSFFGSRHLTTISTSFNKLLTRKLSCWKDMGEFGEGENDQSISWKMFYIKICIFSLYSYYFLDLWLNGLLKFIAEVNIVIGN